MIIHLGLKNENTTTQLSNALQKKSSQPLKKSVANGSLTIMEGFVASATNPPRLGEINVNKSWNESLSRLGSEEAEIMIGPILSRFSGKFLQKILQKFLQS